MMLQYFLVILWISDACALSLLYKGANTTYDGRYPEQLHIAYGSKPDEMTVTWSTLDHVDASVVEVAACPSGFFGDDCVELVQQYGLQWTVNGTVKPFVDGGSNHRTQYIHRVYLSGLKPLTNYTYRCGADPFWSKSFQFRSQPAQADWSPRFAVYGDFGVINAQSLARLYQDVRLGLYDAVIHNGDMAYNMDDEESRRGDLFMNMIEPIAANVPYMVSVGNHEQAYNFSNYVERFTMPNSYDNSNLIWSANIGPVHLISFSTEFYFYLEYGIAQIRNQFEWLKQDLEWASSPENRTLHPWIIVFGHRPMYCSTSLDDGLNCGVSAAILRDGIPELAEVSLETLFYKFGVDLCIWAHEHNYERMWPVYRSYVLNGSFEEPYVDPRAPVHMLTGAAGNEERNNDFNAPFYPYTAFRSFDYGYSRMQVLNATHLYWEQVSDDKAGAVIDKMTIVKHQHGPFPNF